MCEVLVAESLDRFPFGQEEESAQFLATARQRRLVEVRERHDQLHVVLVDDSPKGGDIIGIVDPRHEHVPVRVVERRRERVRIGGDRRRAGAAEGADDVHALARAGEEDGRHDGEVSLSKRETGG